MTVRERPILMSGPMVRAILDGRKTQTRRVVKPQPPERTERVDYNTVQKAFVPWAMGNTPSSGVRVGAKVFPCPFGQPGDRLWVRETWTADSGFAFSDMPDAWWHELPTSLRTRKAAMHLYYKADESSYHGPGTDDEGSIGNVLAGYQISGHEWEGVKWSPSIYMPRWASRLTLEITEVRVERLREISEDDAIAEGIEREGGGFKSYETIATRRHAGEPHPHAVVPNRSAIISYRELWDSLNARRGFGWGTNPWVWVVSFRRLA